MNRVETKYLFSDKVSPFVKSCVLKKRAGIPLNEHEQHRLKTFNESVVSMVSPTAHSQKMGFPPPPKVSVPIGKEEKIEWDDINDDEELDLQELIDEFMLEMELDEILKEMGYEG